MEKLIISMIGENLHGKVLSSFLNKNGIIHKCIIEKGTSRSKKREQWLKPHNENFSIESEALFVKILRMKVLLKFIMIFLMVISSMVDYQY